jgi:hypothetical protein
MLRAHPVIAVVPLAKTISPSSFFAAFPAMPSGLASAEKWARLVYPGWRRAGLPICQLSRLQSMT